MPRLEAPQSYRNASRQERLDVSNGCGPGGASHVVPNTILGLDVVEACHIHDWEYVHADDMRSVVDARFLRNLYALIDAAGGWLRRPRRWIAWYWYSAVSRFGGPRFG